jgi:hypothetical protein
MTYVIQVRVITSDGEVVHTETLDNDDSRQTKDEAIELAENMVEFVYMSD